MFQEVLEVLFPHRALPRTRQTGTCTTPMIRHRLFATLYPAPKGSPACIEKPRELSLRTLIAKVMSTDDCGLAWGQHLHLRQRAPDQ